MEKNTDVICKHSLTVKCCTHFVKKVLVLKQYKTIKLEQAIYINNRKYGKYKPHVEMCKVFVMKKMDGNGVS
jgi:hypothetical protein